MCSFLWQSLYQRHLIVLLSFIYDWESSEKANETIFCNEINWIARRTVVSVMRDKLDSSQDCRMQVAQLQSKSAKSHSVLVWCAFFHIVCSLACRATSLKALSNGWVRRVAEWVLLLAPNKQVCRLVYIQSIIVLLWCTSSGFNLIFYCQFGSIRVVASDFSTFTLVTDIGSNSSSPAIPATAASNAACGTDVVTDKHKYIEVYIQ